MTILVVDDERNIADSIAGTLIAELNTDAEVHVCYGSQQAKDFSATHYIDVIVCDIDMPKCNGISLCRSLLASYPLSLIHIYLSIDIYDCSGRYYIFAIA